MRRSPSSSGIGSSAATRVSSTRYSGRRVAGEERGHGVGPQRPHGGPRAVRTATPTAMTVVITTTSTLGRASVIEKAAAGVDDRGRHHLPDGQPQRVGEQRQDEVFGQQHRSDEARRGPDDLEQPDPAGLRGGPSGGQRGHARDGQETEQPATDDHDRLTVPR